MNVQELIQLATEAREQAYVPYSHFKVGAALLSEDGRVFRGANIENASYGLTVCAERTAMFKAVSEGANRFKAIAVVTDLADPASPCGACRQVLAEFAPDLEVIMANTQGNIVRKKLVELLPLAFTPQKLEESHERQL